MSIYSLPAIIAFTINASLFFLVLLDKPKDKINQLFSFFILTYVFFNIAEIISINSVYHNSIDIAVLIINLSILFSFYFLTEISFSFPTKIISINKEKKIRILLLIPVVLLSVFFLIITLLHFIERLELGITDEISEILIYPFSIFAFSNGNNSITKSINILALILCFIYLALSAYNFFKRLYNKTIRNKSTIVLILFSLVGIILLFIFQNIFYKQEKLSIFWSSLSTIIICFFSAYSILGNKLIPIRRFIKGGITYSVISAIIFAIYVTVINSISNIMSPLININSIFVQGIIIIILVLLIQPLAIKIQSLVDMLFYQNIFRYRNNFYQFTKNIIGQTSLENLIDSISIFLKETMLISKIEVLIKRKSNIYPDNYYEGMLNKEIIIQNDSKILKYFSQKNNFNSNEKIYLEVEEAIKIYSEKENEFLKEFKFGLIFPFYSSNNQDEQLKKINSKTNSNLLVNTNEIIGFLLISSPQKEKLFTAEEIEILSIFVNEVSIAFQRNYIAEKIKEEELKIAQMEKLAALGRLTASIAHEFRNPLNIISTSAQTILRNLDNIPLHKETASYIVEEANRLNITINDFLQLAKPHNLVWEKGSIELVIDKTIDLLQKQFINKPISIKKIISENIEITTSFDHLQRALINLGINGIEAMEDNGILEFAAYSENDNTIISVRDTGKGIPKELQTKVLDPFFTTKPNGTGLGLSIAYIMIESLKGQLTFNTNENGTTFYIKLPND